MADPLSPIPPSTMETVGEWRDFCAALPGSQETFPFDRTTLVWKVGGKMYALTDISADALQISVKVRPEDGARLRSEYQAAQPGHHLNKRHWITVTLGRDVGPQCMTELVRGSHALVVQGLTRAARAELGL